MHRRRRDDPDRILAGKDTTARELISDVPDGLDGHSYLLEAGVTPASSAETAATSAKAS
ncbi:hypothetical protein [Dactylosporangium sp. CA-233914]|uniref:hypothetical protein n=1 Tax=Dactylosporangium sp. CA-233914 TaxID=3239934 RepID=UPI003D903ED0